MRGKRYARKGHVPFEVAGDGNQDMVTLLKALS